MQNKELIVMIVGMSLVTYLPRMMPAMFLAKRTLHPYITEWLSFIPTAVLAAMLAPALTTTPDGTFSLATLSFAVFVPTFAYALWKKNFFMTIALGMGFMAFTRYFAG